MIRDLKELNRGGYYFADFRYDEGIRIREEKVCPTLLAMSDRGIGGESLSGYPLLIEVIDEITECN